jgi:hypothetical protein
MLCHQNWVTPARIEGHHSRSKGTYWSWSCSPFVKPYCCFLVAVGGVWRVWHRADQIANAKPSMRITWIMSLRKLHGCWSLVCKFSACITFSLKKRNRGGVCGVWNFYFEISFSCFLDTCWTAVRADTPARARGYIPPGCPAGYIGYTGTPTRL